MPREGPSYFPAQPSLQVSAEELPSPDTAHLFRIANTCALENQASRKSSLFGATSGPSSLFSQGWPVLLRPSLEANQKPEGSVTHALKEGSAPPPIHLSTWAESLSSEDPSHTTMLPTKGLKKKKIIMRGGRLGKSH